MRWFFAALMSSYFLAAPALAESPNQQYADVLCIGLRHAYGSPTLTFRGCKPAGYDTAIGDESYWVWDKWVHAGHVDYQATKTDGAGNTMDGPYSISRWQYKHLKPPTEAERLAA